SLRDDRRIPTGTTATIAKSSLLGANYVRLDLAPGRRLDTGPYLASGETIARTAVQPDLEQISAKVGPLLAALGGQDIATISGESATALGGRGRRLNTLVSRAADVGEQYAAASADLGQIGRASCRERLERSVVAVGVTEGRDARATVQS